MFSDSVRQTARLVAGAAPAVLVATVIPLTLFYSVSAWAGMQGGIIASLTWAYANLGRQFLVRRQMSGLLTLTSVTLTFRCVTYAVHQSPFTYFAVPVAETLATSLLFVGTMLIGRPLLVSLARDFVPSLGDHLGRHEHRRLVRDLSCVWGLVYLGSALSSGTILLTQSLHWFLLLHQASGWIWSGSGLAISFWYGRRYGMELIDLAKANLKAGDTLPVALVPAVAAVAA
jgi:hypothetical protein